jgi:hypothetical protein
MKTTCVRIMESSLHKARGVVRVVPDIDMKTGSEVKMEELWGCDLYSCVGLEGSVRLCVKAGCERSLCPWRRPILVSLPHSVMVWEEFKLNHVFSIYGSLQGQLSLFPQKLIKQFNVWIFTMYTF